jgi:GNAT superfamily N-acetyltransferase
MASPTPPSTLRIELATESDISRLMEIQFSAFFAEPVDIAINGPNTPESRQKAGERLLNQMRNDPSLHTIKCVRTDPTTKEDSIVGFCEWFIYDKERPEREWRKEHTLLDCMWIEDDVEREKVRGYVLPVFEARMRIMEGRPYALLMYICVDPDWQRQGAGGMLVKWGTGRADELAIECILESSPFGYGLYRKCGFEDEEQLAVTIEGTTYHYPAMLRKPVSVR